MALLNLELPGHLLQARAEISFVVRDGKTRLGRSFAEPPLQVQRALYLDDSVPDMAFLFLLNPTPGLFQGDVQTLRVDAGADTRVHLTTPSATKIYAMPDGDARQDLELTLGKSSYLEYLPEPLIPFGKSRLLQRTQVQLASAATLVMGELVVPGRVASGESFAFCSLDRRLTVTGPSGNPIFHQASLVAPEELSPIGRSVINSDFPVMGTLLVIALGQEIDGLWEQLSAGLSSAVASCNHTRTGLSRLHGGSGLVITVLSKETKSVKAILRDGVETVRRHFLGSTPQLRRNL